MSYTNGSLAAGEFVLYKGTVSFWRVVRGFCISVAAWVPLVLVLAPQGLGIWSLCAGWWLFAALFQRWSTEYAVTNRRVLVNTGFISRSVREVAYNKVEGADVEQSVIGRLLGVGHVRFRGTGSQSLVFVNVQGPLNVKKRMQSSVDN